MNQRKKKEYSWGRKTILFYSHKNERHIWLEGSFELQVALHLEFDPMVWLYVSQPQSIYYDGGKKRPSRYTFDFAIFYHPENKVPRRLVEARPSIYVDKGLREKVRMVRNHLREHGDLTPFEIYTENEIASQVALENYKEFYPLKSADKRKLPSSDDIRLICGSKFTLLELQTKLTEAGLPAVSARALVAHEMIKTDFNQRITGGSELCLH